MIETNDAFDPAMDILISEENGIEMIKMSRALYNEILADAVLHSKG